MKHTVLVVDDDTTVQYTIKRILEGAGLEVELASSGIECIQKIQGGFRGLILMDVVMPELDGWDTIKAICEAGLFEGNIVCMLTGNEVPDTKMEYLKEYVIDYIRKPFESKNLIQLVNEYLSYL